MKVQFLAAYRRSGISKKTNRPYDFSQVEYAMPLRQVDSETYQQTGVGFEAKTLELANGCIADFNGLALGEQVDLKINPNPEDPSRNMCFGIL